MSSDVQVILAVIGMVVLFGGVIWLVVMQKKKTRLALREAAEHLGLGECTQEEAGDNWKISEAYQGNIDGVLVRVGYGQKLVMAGAQALPLTGVIVEARYANPFAHEFAIKRGVFGMPRDLTHPDDQFEAACAVTCKNSIAMFPLLEDVRLRRQLAEFLKNGAGCSVVDQEGVHAVVLNAHFAGSAAIKEKIAAARELAVAIQKHLVRG